MSEGGPIFETDDRPKSRPLPPVILETPRLTIRHLSLDDLDALATIQADPEVMRFFPAGPRDRAEARRDLDRCLAIQARHGHSLWATITKADNRLIGRAGLLPEPIQGRDEVELAYLIERSRWGLGLATEAARAILDHGFRTLGLDRIVAVVHRDNLASRRVLEKLGLRPERLIQFARHRCWLYAVHASDRGAR